MGCAGSLPNDEHKSVNKKQNECSQSDDKLVSYISEKEENIYSAQKNECNQSDYKKCDAMKRLMEALNRYTDVMKNKTDSKQDEFIRFMEEEYKIVVNDYNHFKQQHKSQLEAINDELDECDLNKCEFSARHHAQQRTNTTDPKMIFYSELFDGIHFYLFHCFETGLRMRKNRDNDEDEKEDENEAKDPFYDAVFARFSRRIAERRSATALFRRFSGKNNKYNLINVNKKVENKKYTYLDQMVKNLLILKFSDLKIKSLVQFIQEMEFDSDAIEDDHDIKTFSNISIHCINQQKEPLLRKWNEFIKDTKLESSSFSIGYRFYYWTFYQNMDEIPTDKRLAYDTFDHSGYRIKELFVKQKHGSFKEEIAEYKYVTLKAYQSSIKTKATQYLNSEIIKRTTAIFMSAVNLHYEIRWKDALSFDHLVALILYTDYSLHSSVFSVLQIVLVYLYT